MDEITEYNKLRWEQLAKANVFFSRPLLDLDTQQAREVVDPEGMMEEIAGKDVLCLAGGGGQQSVAFALLGANVTVLDFSETQLKRDEEAAAHYKLQIRTVQADMRDLSCFANASFDIIWQPPSLCYVPDVRPVFREVARILRVDGLYRLHTSNPFVHGVSEKDWNGQGYSLRHPYRDGAEIPYEDPYWELDGEKGRKEYMKGPREFRHALSTLSNALIEQGFLILGIWEGITDYPEEDVDPEPGTWKHFKSIIPPYLIFWACYRTYAFRKKGVPSD